MAKSDKVVNGVIIGILASILVVVVVMCVVKNDNDKENFDAASTHCPQNGLMPGTPECNNFLQVMGYN